MAVVIDGTNGISSPDYEVDGVTGQIYPIVRGTAVASTSGTSIDFTSIPSWVRRITVMFSGVSTNSTSIIQLQLGDSGGVEITGYSSSATALINTGTVIGVNSTTGFALVGQTLAANLHSGIVTLTSLGSNIWACAGVLGNSAAASTFNNGGTKTLSDTLDRVRITTVNGTDTFDAGTINILYE
jgi:hypothetical protein